MFVVLLPLLAVAVIGLSWFWLSNRTQREPATSVAQFSRALTALAPAGTPGPDRRPEPTAANEAS